MDKPETPTGSIEDELLGKIGSMTLLPDNEMPEELRVAVSDFKTQIESELWQAWEVAQAFSYSEERSRILDERRALDEEKKRFHGTVRAFNDHVLKHHREHKSEKEAPEGFIKHGDAEPLLTQVAEDAQAAVDDKDTVEV